jgi:hypothetical protein
MRNHVSSRALGLKLEGSLGHARILRGSSWHRLVVRCRLSCAVLNRGALLAPWLICGKIEYHAFLWCLSGLLRDTSPVTYRDARAHPTIRRGFVMQHTALNTLAPRRLPRLFLGGTQLFIGQCEDSAESDAARCGESQARPRESRPTRRHCTTSTSR